MVKHATYHLITDRGLLELRYRLWGLHPPVPSASPPIFVSIFTRIQTQIRAAQTRRESSQSEVLDFDLRKPGAHVARFLKLYAWLEVGCPTVKRPLSQLVLRNREKREYVRGAALVPLRTRCQAVRERTGYVIDVILGQALLTKICWYTELPKWRVDEEACKSGLWAGDPVDIVSADKAELREDWKDFSDGVVKLLERLTAFRGNSISLCRFPTRNTQGRLCLGRRH